MGARPHLPPPEDEAPARAGVSAPGGAGEASSLSNWREANSSRGPLLDVVGLVCVFFIGGAFALLLSIAWGSWVAVP